MESFFEKIGKRIKMIRFYAGIKQKEMAEKLNIQASLLSLYEQGKREPSISFLRKFCIFFDISLSEFFAFVEDEVVRDKKTNKELQLMINDLKDTVLMLEKSRLSKVEKEPHVKQISS